jgi:hypothetical protein
MKKMFYVVAAFLSIATVSAQSSLGNLTKDAQSVSKEATKAATNGFDVSSISNDIMGSLTKNLRLTKEQKPQVTAVVNDLLNKKKDILPLATTDKKAYDSKMTSNRNSFSDKMKKIISPDQMKLLHGLLPKGSTTSNVLSQLLF